jgi:plasmid stabilization system protein ParE
MQKRTAFGMDIAHEETCAEHERFWGTEETRRQTMELVDKIRSLGLPGKKGTEPTVREPPSGSELADYCSRIHAEVRYYRKARTGIVAIRVATVGDSKKCRVGILLKRTKRPTALVQLRGLQSAVRTGSNYKIEKAYSGLSPEAWEYFVAGYKAAGRAGRFRDFHKVDEYVGKIFSRPIPNSEFLELVLPYAIAATPRRGRPSVRDRDRAVAALLKIFKEVTGRRTSSAKRGGFDGPVGDGADFLRALEKIFRIDLLPTGSTHAIGRAENY